MFEYFLATVHGQFTHFDYSSSAVCEVVVLVVLVVVSVRKYLAFPHLSTDQQQVALAHSAALSHHRTNICSLITLK